LLPLQQSFKKEIITGTISYGISYQLIDIYTGYAGAIGMLLNINGKFTIKESFG
jgi:hypothetical protein